MSPSDSHHGGNLTISNTTNDELLQDLELFVRYGFKTLQHGRAIDFFLLKSDGSGLRFSSSMLDIAERLEIGVISPSTLTQEYTPELIFSLPDAFLKKMHAERLAIENEHGKFNSGIALVTDRGDELLLLPGAYPYTIEVRVSVALMSEHKFDPEYPPEKYTRERFLVGLQAP